LFVCEVLDLEACLPEQRPVVGTHDSEYSSFAFHKTQGNLHIFRSVGEFTRMTLLVRIWPVNQLINHLISR
jgi:hypothetical protein